MVVNSSNALNSGDSCRMNGMEEHNARSNNGGWSVYPTWANSKDQGRLSSPSSSSGSLNTDDENSDEKAENSNNAITFDKSNSLNPNMSQHVNSMVFGNNEGQNSLFYHTYWSSGLEDKIESTLKAFDQSCAPKNGNIYKPHMMHQDMDGLMDQPGAKYGAAKGNFCELKKDDHDDDHSVKANADNQETFGNNQLLSPDFSDKEWLKMYQNTAMSQNLYRREMFEEFALAQAQDNALQNHLDLKYGGNQSPSARLDACKFGMPNQTKCDTNGDCLKNNLLQGMLLNQKYNSQLLHDAVRRQSSVPVPIPQKVCSGNNFPYQNSLDDVMDDFRSNGWDCESLGLGRGASARAATLARAQACVQAHVQAHTQAQAQAQAMNRLPMRRPASYPPGGQNLFQPTNITTKQNVVENPMEVIDQLLQRLLFIRQQTLCAQQQQQYTQPILSQLHPSYKKKRPVTAYECAFCRNNGEQESFYKGHMLRDQTGRVVCPVLREFHCPGCGATGDHAHTIKYCPLTTHSDAPSIMQQLKTLRLTNAKKRNSTGGSDPLQPSSPTSSDSASPTTPPGSPQQSPNLSAQAGNNSGQESAATINGLLSTAW